MRYAGIIYNDFSAAPGVCLTFFTQGCPHRCKGCHNPETWDFNDGKEFTDRTLDSIIQGLQANGIHRNLCIMGGEPLCTENTFLTKYVIQQIKRVLPETKVYIWSGYTYEELKIREEEDINLWESLQWSDYLIDGPYIAEQRDITLPMRGSRNQRVIDLKSKKIIIDV